MTDQERMALELAGRAYAEGFKAGADHLRARRRTTVEPTTHAHWREGFEAGRTAADAAIAAYRAGLKERIGSGR